MCLAVPAKIIALQDSLATVELTNAALSNSENAGPGAHQTFLMRDILFFDILRGQQNGSIFLGACRRPHPALIDRQL